MKNLLMRHAKSTQLVALLFLFFTFAAQSLGAADSKKLLKDTPFEEILAKANAGDGQAQLFLAKAHGDVLSKLHNKNESLRWYLAAGTNGVVEAEVFLGKHYYEAALAIRGTTLKDREQRTKIATESLSWFLKAGRQASPEAWRRLGHAFDDGKLFAKDSIEAYKWYHLAVENGDNGLLTPKRERDALSAKLSPAQIEIAKRRAKEFWDSLGAPKKPTAPK